MGGDIAKPDTRTVHVNNDVENARLRQQFKYTNNWVSTSKYTMFNFVPKTILEFFRVVANGYFLCISLLQVLTDWSPTNQYTTAGPLLIVLMVSMTKQAIEDKKRHDADAIQNCRICHVMTANGAIQEKQWQDVQVGDILFLKDKDELPADVLILATSEEEGRCFVETCNLDGETNLKRRTACEPIAKLIGFRALNDPVIDEAKHKASCMAFRGSIEYEQPNNRLYNFTGVVKADALADAAPIGPTNVILRGCSIRSCSYIFGIVLFAGKESKLMQNARATPSKQSNVYKMVNRCIMLIFLTQFTLCVISTVSFNAWVHHALKLHSWYLPFIRVEVSAFFTFLILYNNLVPISLYVSLDMVKVVAQAKNISSDEEMCHEGFYAIARTSDLNEDLGQIEYIFSDKTGTLTQNIMEFRKCSIGGVVYGYGSTEIAAAVARLAKHEATPATANDRGPATNLNDAQIFLDKSIHFDDPRLVVEAANPSSPNGARIREFLTLLAVCHTVIPETNATTGLTTYRASSPDEEALVKAARCLGYKLVTPAPFVEVEITHKGTSPTMLGYSILNVNEFNSTRKRMSVVVLTPHGTVVVYCKGADNVILPRCALTRTEAVLDEHLKTFASEGLRTLVLAKREMSKADYDAWNKTYQAAATSLSDRDAMLDAAAEALEVNMTIVGATAIEDKLQVGVPNAIHSLAQAGIKIWVLTGDKEETAVNIGHACRLLNDGMQLLYVNREDLAGLVEQVDYLYNMEAIQDHYKSKTVAENIGIVCDGKSLVHFFPSKSLSANDKVTAKELRRKLLVVASVCKAMVACRVSPAQKADIVNLVRYNSRNKPITLAIGDGANDVNMIQSAHVGIGICGQEGVQAVNASDYAIAQFRFLQRLLLVHGRSNYKRIAKVILYSFYKNMSLVIVLFFYNFYNGQSGTSLFESFVMAGWNFFLALPIIAIGIFDEDVSPEQAMAFPALYTTGQRNDDLNVYRFCIWIANAIFHAVLSFWLPIYIVVGYTTEAFHLQGTTIYTGLLMTMNCKVIMETMSWTMFNHGFIVFSVVLYFFFLGVYPLFTFLSWDMVGITPILLSSGIYWAVFFLVPVANFLVDLSLKFWVKFYSPTDADILRERYVIRRGQSKVSCGVSEARKPRGQQDYVDRRGSIERTPDQLIADKKAGVRNVDDVKYTGFAYSSPDSTGRGSGSRDIASLRVDQLQQTGRVGEITELRRLSASPLVPPPVGQSTEATTEK
ncbi:hypothetical protein H310_07047 [Aphanomyces invadans]|uniref:Phospholipid-transporting ATPase n=1 Tax=Aphanomyces invadans TaxID=157072 RepID=A0A024U2J4_9STRA|nr:hypothetical protein H310_07047 [Aphanomyces invadans]ETW00410.1 hypothetical protein H310_07047 [Aphanomyces invadans]|eukprot:XP_008870545.1 hypothetical protein H310_07047 [Aphanomyces invadans]